MNYKLNKKNNLIHNLIILKNLKKLNMKIIICFLNVKIKKILYKNVLTKIYIF